MEKLSKSPSNGFCYNVTDIISSDKSSFYQGPSWGDSLSSVEDISLKDAVEALFDAEAAEHYAQIVEKYDDEIDGMRGCEEIPPYMGSALSLLAKDTSLIPKLNLLALTSGASSTVVSGFTKAFAKAISGLPLLVGDSAYCFAIGKKKIFETCAKGATLLQR